MATTGERCATGAGGFSLAEVVVALGILASVLISVAGLLVLGNRMVWSGRGSSEALSVARDVLEEMQGWSFEQTFLRLGCDGAQPTCSVLVKDSGAVAVPILAQWQDLLHANLYRGEAEIRIESLEAVPLAASRGLRITVSISWLEAQRSRSAQLVTVRV